MFIPFREPCQNVPLMLILFLSFINYYWPFFLGFFTFPVYQWPVNVYYFVPELKTFFEAQQYCRETYTDLATIESMNDLNLLATEQVPYSGAWIGLSEGSTFHWYWALADKIFYREGEREYRNWAPLEPDSFLDQDCVIMTYKGQFENTNCLDTFNFICYDGE